MLEQISKEDEIGEVEKQWLQVGRLRCKFQFCHWFAVWPWAGTIPFWVCFISHLWRKDVKTFSKCPSSVSCDRSLRLPTLSLCHPWIPLPAFSSCLQNQGGGERVSLSHIAFHLNSELLSDWSTFLWKWQQVGKEYLRCYVQIRAGKSRERQSPDCSGLTLLLQDDVNSAVYRNKSSVSWGFLMFKTRWYFLPWSASELWFPWQPWSSTYCNFPVLWASSSSTIVPMSLENKPTN